MVTITETESQSILSDFEGIEDNFYAITDIAEDSLFRAEKEMWKVCCASALVVGNFEPGKTSEFAGRLGKSIASVQFYAKAWRVRNYVEGQVVNCSYGVCGKVNSYTVLNNLTFSHYGHLHSKIFVSKRTDEGMEYVPIMEPNTALGWLAECIENLATDGKRLSWEALLFMMSTSPDTVQFFEVWGSWRDKIQNFILEWGEKMPQELREILSELVKKEWGE